MRLPIFISAVILAGATLPAFGQSSPNFSYGQVPTAAQWNNAFSQKQDVLPFSPLSLAGGTLNGRLSTAPSTVIAAKFAMPPGVAPASPANGDMWATSTGFFGFINNTRIQFADQGTVTAETNRAQTAEATKAPIASPTFTGTVTAPIVALTNPGSTGPIDAMSATPPGRGASSAVSNLFDATFTLLSFKAKDDNATDNTAVVQAAVNAAVASGRALRVTASTGGTGIYRIGSGINWQNVNLEFDEKAGFANLDGTAYSGTSYSGFVGLPAVFNPQIAATGRRAVSPGRNAAFLKAPGDTHETFTTYIGNSANPYDVTSGERSYALLGQSTPSSGSWAGLGIFANVYSHSNGPGYSITCTGTNGSNVLTSCSPAPNGTHTVTLGDGTSKVVNNVFNPAAITGTGVPTGTYAAAWDSSTITLAASGTFYSPQNFTGTTGSVTVNVQSGRSEFNTQSLQINPIGSTSSGGPAGGMNWYADDIVSSNISTSASDQEGFLAGREIVVRKQAPGNLKDVLHNGSSMVAALTLPNGGNTTYPLDAGMTITGWTGATSVAGGTASGATYAAFTGLRVGGPCQSVYCYASSRSYFKVGVDAEDYEDTAFLAQTPHAGGIAKAFVAAPGAGNSGFGTITPQSTLSVTATSADATGIANSGAGGVAQFTTGTGATGDNKLALGVVDGAYSWLQALQPAVAFRNLVLQPKGGNVGIGTTTPGALLDVAGTVRTPQALLTGYTVATLPTCNTAAKGTLTMATDVSSAPTYRQTGLTGGGTIAVPVFCNGSAYEAH